jgi:hypothetical protein
MSCPIDVSVYISHMGNVDLLTSNIVRFYGDGIQRKVF